MSAKSPTPIPTPPVKIHRGAATAAPVRRRKKKAPQPPAVVFAGPFAAALFRPENGLQVCVAGAHPRLYGGLQLQRGPQRLFQGALAPRRIVDLMLEGYDVTNFEQNG